MLSKQPYLFEPITKKVDFVYLLNSARTLNGFRFQTSKVATFSYDPSNQTKPLTTGDRRFPQYKYPNCTIPDDLADWPNLNEGYNDGWRPPYEPQHLGGLQRWLFVSGASQQRVHHEIRNTNFPCIISSRNIVGHLAELRYNSNLNLDFVVERIGKILVFLNVQEDNFIDSPAKQFRDYRGFKLEQQMTINPDIVDCKLDQLPSEVHFGLTKTTLSEQGHEMNIWCSAQIDAIFKTRNDSEGEWTEIKLGDERESSWKYRSLWYFLQSKLGRITKFIIAFHDGNGNVEKVTPMTTREISEKASSVEANWKGNYCFSHLLVTLHAINDFMDETGASSISVKHQPRGSLILETRPDDAKSLLLPGFKKHLENCCLRGNTSAG